MHSLPRIRVISLAQRQLMVRKEKEMSQQAYLMPEKDVLLFDLRVATTKVEM
jgi:hypothetical protein